MKLNPHLISKEIQIHKLQKTGDRTPILSYSTLEFGQSNYLLIRCKEEGIAAIGTHEEVQIFSERKLPQFIELIKESLQYVDKPYVELKKRTVNFWSGQTLICVMIKDTDHAYVTEGHMSKLVWHMYKREIPRVSHFKIFHTKKELSNYLLEKEGLII